MSLEVKSKTVPVASFVVAKKQQERKPKPLLKPKTLHQPKTTQAVAIAAASASAPPAMASASTPAASLDDSVVPANGVSKELHVPGDGAPLAQPTDTDTNTNIDAAGASPWALAMPPGAFLWQALSLKQELNPAETMEMWLRTRNILEMPITPDRKLEIESRVGTIYSDGERINTGACGMQIMHESTNAQCQFKSELDESVFVGLREKFRQMASSEVHVTDLLAQQPRRVTFRPRQSYLITKYPRDLRLVKTPQELTLQVKRKCLNVNFSLSSYGSNVYDFRIGFNSEETQRRKSKAPLSSSPALMSTDDAERVAEEATAFDAAAAAAVAASSSSSSSPNVGVTASFTNITRKRKKAPSSLEETTPTAGKRRKGGRKPKNAAPEDADETQHQPGDDTNPIPMDGLLVHGGGGATSSSAAAAVAPWSKSLLSTATASDSTQQSAAAWHLKRAVVSEDCVFGSWIISFREIVNEFPPGLATGEEAKRLRSAGHTSSYLQRPSTNMFEIEVELDYTLLQWPVVKENIIHVLLELIHMTRALCLACDTL